MQAIQLTEAIGPNGLHLTEINEPDSTNLVLVDLYASGVSFPDLLQTAAGYQIVRQLPFVLGVEGAGIVRTAPENSGFVSGQRVAVLAPSGSWQETVAVEPRTVFPLPESVSLEVGAGFLLNYLTIHFALTERARYRSGEIVLVHGGAGGIGIAALQVAAALGLETIAVVSTETKAAVARANRATHVVLTDCWKKRVQEITGNRGVDIILDPVGGDRFTDSLRSLAPNGRVVVLGFTGGDIPTVKVNRLLLANISVLGAGWGEHVRKNPHYPAAQWDELVPLLHSGRLQITEPTVYSPARVGDALRSLEDRSAAGKIVIQLRTV